MSTTRKSYPSDVTDVEWEFLWPYLTLMREDAPQREYTLRDLFDAMRYVVKTGCQWRYLPHDFPPWAAVYQQARRWLAAHVFEDAAHDLREMIRLAVEGCRRNGIHSGLCGQAPSDYPDMAEFLVRIGIESMSLNPDTVVKTTRQVLELERQLVPTSVS